MKKTITLLAVVALLSAACSSSDDASEASTTTVAETTTTVAETTTTAAETTTTVAETTTSTVRDISTSPVVPGEDEDADAIVEVYAVVFDSSTTYEEKAPFIDDPAGLETTVEQYTAAGAGVGGILLEVTAVGTDGDSAEVVYDLLFAGNPFQIDQKGAAIRIEGQWQVTREFFCSVMDLARVGCP
jgi:ABC-type Fe3+-hydroxamate transport system substrate-binding protein